MSSERRRAMDGPSARAVGQAGEPKEPDEVGRISGGGLSFGDFSLATQRKVTRPSPKGGETLRGQRPRVLNGEAVPSRHRFGV